MQTPDNKSVLFFKKTADLLPFIQKIQASQLIFLCDTNTHKHCFLPCFSELNLPVLSIPQGDHNKNPEQLLFICNELIRLKADRHALLINLGGGMICDIGGFAASVFKRGIRFVNIPTTTLAMADAAFGGKTGINLPLLKNAVGTFQPAETVCIAPGFLQTLPQREQLAGFAEIAKMLLLFEPETWQRFSQTPVLPPPESQALFTLLQLALKAKIRVVQQDPLEKNIRKSLNYGHSIGHALEAVYNRHSEKLLHGEAVFWGMQLENRIAEKTGLMSAETRQEINSVLARIFPLPNRFENIDWITQSLLNDKKNQNGQILMTLLSKPAQFNYNVQVPLETITQVLQNLPNGQPAAHL